MGFNVAFKVLSTDQVIITSSIYFIFIMQCQLK